MLARRFTFVVNQKLCGRTLVCNKNCWFSQTVPAYGIDHEKIMYEWREKEANLHRSKLGDNPDKPKKVLWHPTSAPKESDFSIGNIVNWYAHHDIEAIKLAQQFIPERHDILGSNLATAHFIVSRGGRVKFRGHDNWIEKDEDGKYNLPRKFNPEYVIEAVDVNGFDLHYEGLSNFCSLVKLKWLSLKDCKNIDDWCLDKISGEYPQLEYLDISGCGITERGLESLYRMLMLKKLIVTNYHKSTAFELTCMMLEDCIPTLTCEILMPEEKSEKKS